MPQDGEDALHPVRHLREAFGSNLPRPGPPFDGAASTNPAPSTAEHPVQARHRRWPWVGAILSLALVPALVATPGLLRQAQPRAPASTASIAIFPSPALVPPTGVSPAAIATAGSTGQTVSDIRMFSQDAGWSQRLADGTILHTTDGEDWTAATPPTLGRVLAVAYLDARSAIALTVPQDPVGAVVVQTWTTDDGGTSWAQQGTLLLGALTDQVEGMVFDNPSDGWVSIDEAASGFHGMVVYHTASGGDHWDEVARTTNG